MAIIQERVIALINASLDYQQALHKMAANIATAVKSVKDGLNTPESALQEIELVNLPPESLLLDRSGSPTTIAIEHYHFARNARRNARIRDKMARKRPPRTRYPHTTPYATERLIQPIALRQSGQNTKGAFSSRSSTSPQTNLTYTMADVDEAIRLQNQQEQEEIERQRAIGNLPLSEQDAADDLADSTFDPSLLSDNEEH